MNTLISSQSYYAKLINLSGKQRMLSQKSAFLVSKYIQKNQVNYIDELKKAINTFEKNHHYIVENLSSNAKKLYFGQDNSIDNNVRNYIVVITSFLENPNKKLSDTIYEKSQILLLQLDNAVNFFQQESEAKTKELQQRELLIFIGTILTILFEAHFFARPVIEMIKLKFQDFYEMLNKKDKLIDLQSKFFINAHEGIVITDKENKIIDFNIAFEKVTGYTKSELLGKSPSLLKSGEHNDFFYKEIWHQLNQKGFYKGELINKKKDGKKYIQNVSIFVIKNELNDVTNYCALVQDITNEKKRDRIIEEQIKMSSMGEMIGNIAHQWRQPLSVITTSATGLQLMKEHGVLDDEIFFKNLNQIENTAQYLSKTIDTFKNFLKDKKEYKEDILQNRINNALTIVSATLTNNFIELRNNIDKIEPLKVKIITGELEQVIINVINNAKDAILEKKIKNPWIEIDLKQLNDFAILTIEDNGMGIPEDILPKIFEVYFTTKSEDKGTGLGLHMSFKIITESLNGNIYAKNTQNGAMFTIELPIV
jgi:PAS domain S-box-containing protein